MLLELHCERKRTARQSLSPSSSASAVQHHDLPHRAAGSALDAGEQRGACLPVYLLGARPSREALLAIFERNAQYGLPWRAPGRERNLMRSAARISIVQIPAPRFTDQQCINPNLISFEADRYAVFVPGLDMDVRRSPPFRQHHDPPDRPAAGGLDGERLPRRSQFLRRAHRVAGVSRDWGDGANTVTPSGVIQRSRR